MPKRSRAERMADHDRLAARFPRGARKGDPLDNADRQRKAWCVVREGVTFRPHTRSTDRRFVRGL